MPLERRSHVVVGKGLEAQAGEATGGGDATGCLLLYMGLVRGPLNNIHTYE